LAAKQARKAPLFVRHTKTTPEKYAWKNQEDISGAGKQSGMIP
jgi:hypothetical protein